jgi:serine/threonine protein kinase
MELEILRACSHSNILSLTDSYLTDECLYIVTEYIDGLSLYILSDVSQGRLTEKIISSVMKECLQGLDYIHDLGFIHCDIKSDNILISVDKKVQKLVYNLREFKKPCCAEYRF